MNKRLVDPADINKLVRAFGDLTPAELAKLKRKWLPEYGGGNPRQTGRQLDDPDMGRRVREALMILGNEVRKGEERLEAARQDLLRVYAGSRTPIKPRQAQPYRHTHDQLARSARHAPVRRQKHNVTDFSGWIHSLYGYSYGSPEAIREGKAVERKVQQRFRAPRTDDHWELIYEDPLADGEALTSFPIPALAISDEPMRGRPDLVLRHRPSNILTIIERKSSRAEIPSDGWPDLRAQLWCYAQIDHPAWHQATAIRLVGEVWMEDRHNTLRLRESDGGLMVWMKDDPEFSAQNADLFKKYKATREGRG